MDQENLFCYEEGFKSIVVLFANYITQFFNSS